MFLTFRGTGQSWIIWTLYGAMVIPSGDSIYPRYSQEVMWNSHLSAWAKSLWSLNVEFVLINVVRIDEDVVQIYDDYDVNHKSLQSSRCISKPFITNHSN